MLDALNDLDALGFAGLETWGGATIDSCLRYLGEQPFERITRLKRGTPRTPHLMLLRGQNIVQYKSFPDDVVQAFVRCTAQRGMDIFRIFDALNDLRNVRVAVAEVIRAGAHARGEICYTISPVHTLESFVIMAEEFAEMGCSSIGIKDMAGLMQPRIAYELVRRIKRRVSLPVSLHSHDTAGLAASAYLAAVDAGVDHIETSIVPFANGTSQPDTVRMLALLEGHPRCPHYDRKRLSRLRKHFERVYRELAAFTSPANERTDADTLEYQIPGGMLSNFRNQLKEQGMEDRWDEVAAEIPYVRECLGWVPLVTPTSQIVGAQAMLNVKFGRWKMIAEATADVLLGRYGKTPGPVDPEVQKRVLAQEGVELVTGRPADALTPAMESLKQTLRNEGLPDDEETAVLYAMFPVEVKRLLKPVGGSTAQDSSAVQAKAGQNRRSDSATPGQRSRYVIKINGYAFEAGVEDLT